MNNNIIRNKRNFIEYCTNGFILCPNLLNTDWNNIKFSELNLYYSDSTKIQRSKSSKVLIIGDVYDLENSINSNDILNLIEEKILISLESGVDYIKYLAGRYLILIEKDDLLYIFSDSHCAMACYWSEEHVGVFASHLQLIKDYFSTESNLLLNDIMQNPDYISPGGKYFPGKLTPLNKVFPLIANCFIIYNKKINKVTHERFYPNFSLKQKYKCLDIDQIYYKFKNYLINFIKQSYKSNKTYISLTNGLDSRSILAILMLSDIKIESFTYTKFGGNYPGYEKDLVGAARLSATAGYPHFILSLPELDYSSKFYELYRKTFSLHARFPTLTQAYYEQLPIDANVIVSTISETGTAFYQVREELEITASELAKKWSYSKNNTHTIIHNCFEDYIHYTNFKTESIYDFDFYDLFYWEHRNSKWANLWYQECDLSHNVVLPFNCRLINELMLALPLELRKSKYLLKRLIEDAGLSADPDTYL